MKCAPAVPATWRSTPPRWAPGRGSSAWWATTKPAVCSKKSLAARGVECAFTRLADAPTITKLRVISRHQQLIRLDFEERFDPRHAISISAALAAQLDGVNVLVLSDYAKGTLADVQVLIAAARKKGIPVVVDPKGSDFSRYRGATIVKPNLSEFEAVVGPCPDEATLVAKGEALRAELDLEALLVTRGEAGVTLLQRGQPDRKSVV